MQRNSTGQGADFLCITDHIMITGTHGFLHLEVPRPPRRGDKSSQEPPPHRGRIEPVDTITFHSHGPSGKPIRRVGEGMLTHATHDFKPEHRYVMMEFVDGGGRRAFTNPVYTELFGTR